MENFHWSKKLRKTENFSYNLKIGVPLESINLFLSGGQNLERLNVERSTFQNFKIANIKMTKDELFYSFIVTFLKIFLKLFE